MAWHPLVCFVSETGEWLHAKLRNGQAPRSGGAARSVSARVFAWVPVVTATHYRVRFFEGGDVIFEGWPSKPRLKLPSEWAYRGRRHRLGPGRYSWEVRPATAGAATPAAGTRSSAHAWSSERAGGSERHQTRRPAAWKRRTAVRSGHE